MTDKQKNYIHAMKIAEHNREQIRAINPYADYKSGIYMFHRIDENGNLHAYVGKAIHLIERLAQHLSGYDSHIDKSIRKYGLWSIDNPHGYDVKILCFCELSELDEKEREYIKKANGIYALKNIESGGTTGKTDINERKSPRGYRDGVAQGEKNVIRKIAHLFDLHLKAVTKADKPTKTQEKALRKFYDLIGDQNNEK